ncbi:MAG: hypothetical protein ACUVQ5_01790 [Candidatus Methanomethylicaceae archaeon]
MRSGFTFPLLFLVLVVGISPLIQIVTSNESINIRIQPVIIFDVSNEYVYVQYRGDADIVIAVVKSDPGILVEGLKQVGGTAQGYLKIYLLNTTSKSYLCTLSMVSMQPFSVNVTTGAGDGLSSQGQFVSLPANITAQFELPIVYGSYQAPVQLTSPVGYTPAFPLWSLLAYLAFVPMFLLTAYMDKGSLKASRKRWSSFDSFALAIRYLFYASVVIFVLVSLGMLSEFLLVRFYSVVMQVHVGDWLLSCALLSALGLTYGIGKWRGIFDNIDEED